MSTALSPSIRHPHQAVDGLNAALARLAQLDVDVQYTHSPSAAISRYDGHARTLTIRADACFEDHVWALSQCWFHDTIGPWASLARKVATLHVVPMPAQREPLDDTA